MQLAGIQAVTFDVGGTLIEPWPSVGHIYAKVAAKHGAGQLEVDLLNRRFEAAWKARPGFDYAVEDWSAIVDETFAGLVVDKPSRTFFAELYERFAQAGAWRIYEDVLPTLTTLAECGVRLGVISNWDGRLRPLLTSLGLANRFESIIVSCEIGASKPAPAPFLAAVKALSASPDKILHVGDSFDMDIAGARAAGLQSVQIVRDPGVVAAGQIRSLRELAALVLAGRAAR
jgi:putative hydrolase of the HAD superfamily